MLRAPDTVPALGWAPAMAFDSRGRYFVSSGRGLEVLAFDSTGAFLEKIGRPGDGPGEFRSISGIVILPGDSVAVLGAQRLQIFGPDFTIARTVRPILSLRHPILLENNALMGRFRFGGAGPLAGFASYIVNTADGTARGIGPKEDRQRNARCGDCQAITISPGSHPGRAWLNVANRYEIHEISTDRGTVSRIVSVPGSRWFSPWDSAGNWSSGLAPRPSTIEDLAEGPHGLLWILGVRTVPGWRPTPPPEQPGIVQLPGGGTAIALPGGEVQAWRERLESQFVGVLDVIDPAEAVLLGTMNLGPHAGLLGPGLIYRVHETPELDLAIDIIQVILQR